MGRALFFDCYKDWCNKNDVNKKEVGKENKFFDMMHEIFGKNCKENEVYSRKLVWFNNSKEMKLSLAKYVRMPALFNDIAPEELEEKPEIIDGTKHWSLPGMDAVYWPNFLTEKEMNWMQLCTAIMQKVPAIIEKSNNLMFKHRKNEDKLVPLPRQKFFMSIFVKNDGTIGVHLYRYDNYNSEGKLYDPKPHDMESIPEIITIRNALPPYKEMQPDHLIGNIYRDGNDSIGLHHDKIKDFEKDAPVYTVSFGAPRVLKLSTLYSPKELKAKYEITLQPGSLFILGPKANRLYKHGIDKDTKVKKPRLSFTYCFIKTTVPIEQTSKPYEIPALNEDTKKRA